jgi:hypothetical protein
MASSTKTNKDDTIRDRPEFAAVLGLAPPYTMDDVKRAYLDKVKSAHPDRGGDRTAFDRIQRAFEEGSQYLKFRSDRRQWIAARMDEYLAVQELRDRLRALGAEIESDMLDWVRRSFGDFANLTESIVGVRLTDSPNVRELIETMVRELAALPGLKRLSLAGCPVDNLLALDLRVFKSLAHLDLSRTPITDRALTVVDFLPDLVSLDIEGTSIGWWARHKVERRLRRRRQSRPDPIFHPANVR